MAFEYDDLHTQLDRYLEDIGGVTQIDPGGAPNYRASVFQPGRYNPTYNAAQLDCTYNQFNWAAHLQLNCIAWHDDWGGESPFPPHYGSTIGNAVAVTRRHGISSNHGRDIVGTTVVFAGITNRYGTPADTFAATIVGAVTAVRADGIFDSPVASGGFDVLYFDRDLPLEIIVNVALPADMPTIPVIGTNFRTLPPGIPLLVADQHQQTWIQGLQSYSPVNHILRLNNMNQVLQTNSMPPRPLEGLLWRPMYSGDSGSPLFVMHRNQQMYYFGNTTEAGGSEAVTVFDTYDNLVTACNIASDRFGPGLPKYVPNMIYHDPGGPFPPGYRPPASGPLGP